MTKDVPALALADITCRFAARDDASKAYTAVANATLNVARGEFVSVVLPLRPRRRNLTEQQAEGVAPQERKQRLNHRITHSKNSPHITPMSQSKSVSITASAESLR